MTPAPKRRRLNGKSVQSSNHENNHLEASQGDPYQAPITPATLEQKAAWSGWCEIDSDPAFFNVMLKDFGVRGSKVQELYGLDEDLIGMLPQPVYGLIFLYRYQSDDTTNQEPSCPENIWFANQLSDFSCATVSLLNIVMNIPDAELGEHLSSFKDFTKAFTPALRGQTIANFQFVRSIHNSFARKSDMLNIDLGLQNQYQSRHKSKTKRTEPTTPKKAGSARGKKSKPQVTEDDYGDDVAAFHFSAYVPINGQVWKLDGLDRQPQRVGEYNDGEWMSTATPIIERQMMLYAEGQIEFGLLALVRDPLISHRLELARNIKSIRSVQQRLYEMGTRGSQDGSPKDPTTAEEACKADDTMSVTEEMIQGAEIVSMTEKLLKLESRTDIEQNLADLLTSQRSIKGMIMDEISSCADDERKAQERRQDYGQIIYAWLRMLAEKEGLMKELVDLVR